MLFLFSGLLYNFCVHYLNDDLCPERKSSHKGFPLRDAVQFVGACGEFFEDLFSASFSRFSRSSSCLTMCPSSSEYVLPRLKSRSYGAMLPYHCSSRILIFAYLRPKERAALSRENPIRSRSVLVIRLSFPCHMHVLLFVVAHTISQKVGKVQRFTKELRMISPLRMKQRASLQGYILRYRFC